MNYYSFTDPEGMEGWVGLVGWPIADALPTKWSHVNHGSGVDQGKSGSYRPTFLPLSHAATGSSISKNLNQIITVFQKKRNSAQAQLTFSKKYKAIVHQQQKNNNTTIYKVPQHSGSHYSSA